MKAYCDASILLRLVLSEPGRLKGWDRLEGLVGSDLVEVECLRRLDRMQLTGELTEDETVERRRLLFEMLATLDRVQLTPDILHQAASSLPVPLGTLDAIHLATALSWRSEVDPELVLATHDKALGRAALAFGFKILGV